MALWRAENPERWREICRESQRRYQARKRGETVVYEKKKRGQDRSAPCTACGAAGPFAERPNRPGQRYTRCDACRSAKKKSWKTLNRERVLSQARDYAKALRTDPKTRTKVLASKRASQKAWKAAHPEEHNARALVYTQRRRARLRGASEVSLTPAQWRETLECFGHACAYCLQIGVELTQDHVIPVADGGTHTQDNVIPACRGCNAKKSNRPVWTMVA